MPHPAQIKDAVQVYIERQDRPVRSWQIKDGIANRLDTPHVLVAEALMRLEQGGRICKHVSPESGAEFWFSRTGSSFPKPGRRMSVFSPGPKVCGKDVGYAIL